MTSVCRALQRDLALKFGRLCTYDSNAASRNHPYAVFPLHNEPSEVRPSSVAHSSFVIHDECNPIGRTNI